MCFVKFSLLLRDKSRAPSMACKSTPGDNRTHRHHVFEVYRVEASAEGSGHDVSSRIGVALS